MASRKEKKETIKVDDNDIDISKVEEEITYYMKDRVGEEVEKQTKRLLRYKNEIIMRKNLTIIFLLVIIGVLVYNLYSLSTIKIDITTDGSREKIINKESKTTKKEENKFDKYNYLLDNVFLNSNSTYIDDYYKGNLTREIKLSMINNTLDNELVIQEDNTAYIEENDIEDKYNDLYIDEYEPVSFKYGDLNFNYLRNMEIFITNGTYKKFENDITREIIDVKEDDDIIEVTTVEGIIKNKKLYNIVNKKEVKNYKRDKLSNYKKSLNKITYVFKTDDDINKLVELKKA